MEKSKLGLPVTVLAAIVCLLGFYGGYAVAAVAVGYVLLKEENEWLKKLSVQVICVMLAFSVASTLINLMPNVLSVFYSFLAIFEVSVYVSFIATLCNFLSTALSVLRTLVFLLLGYSALLGKQIKIPLVDPLLDKYLA